MKKVILVGGIVLVLVVGILVVVKVNKKEEGVNPVKLSEVTQVEAKDGTKVNTSEALNKDKMLNGLKISNIQVTTDKNGNTRILADVENTNKTATGIKYITVSIKDKAGKELGQVNGVIVALEAGEKTQLNINATTEYLEAYDFTITEK